MDFVTKEIKEFLKTKSGKASALAFSCLALAGLGYGAYKYSDKITLKSQSNEADVPKQSRKNSENKHLSCIG